MYSCAGHGKDIPAYITLKMDKDTMPKIYSIIKSLHQKEGISYLFAQEEYGREASFTVYMSKEKLRGSYMDIISESLSKEAKLEELPDSIKSIVKLSDIFQANEIGYDLEYNTGKKKSLRISNLKFAGKNHIYENDFKKMGFKRKRDMVNQLFYIKKIRSGVKEQSDLNSILDFVSKKYPHSQKDYFIQNLHDMTRDVTELDGTLLHAETKELKDINEIGYDTNIK